MSETLDIARSLLPYLEEEDTFKAEYMAYRICNFSRKMATDLTGISPRTVKRWHENDPKFAEMDGEGMSILRAKLATEFLDMQFTRNFHLVLKKDFRILYKDAMFEQHKGNGDAAKYMLSPDEREYLTKIRQHYTPQSLAMIKQILGGGTVEEPFNFTKMTLTIDREIKQVEFSREPKVIE